MILDYNIVESTTNIPCIHIITNKQELDFMNFNVFSFYLFMTNNILSNHLNVWNWTCWKIWTKIVFCVLIFYNTQKEYFDYMIIIIILVIYLFLFWHSLHSRKLYFSEINKQKIYMNIQQGKQKQRNLSIIEWLLEHIMTKIVPF